MFLRMYDLNVLKRLWICSTFFYLLSVITVANYLVPKNYSIFVASSLILFIILSIAQNFISGISLFLTYVLGVILFDKVMLPPIFETVLIGLASSCVWLKNLSSFPERRSNLWTRKNSLTFLVILLIGLFQYGPLLFGSAISRLRGNLLSYDFVAHSFLTRAIAFCGSGLDSCQNVYPSIAKNSVFNTYPDGFHLFFGNLFRQALTSENKEFLYAWTAVIFWSFTLCLSVLILSLRSFGIGICKETSSSGKISYFLDDKVPIFFLASLAIIYPFNMGYINFSCSIILILVSFQTFLKKSFLLSFISLLIACEFWSFLYLLTPMIFILILFNLYKRNMFAAILSTPIYLFFLGEFLIRSLASDEQSEAALIGGVHVVEPFIAIVFAVHVLVRSLKNSKVFDLSTSSSYLLGFFLPFFSIFLYLNLYRGVEGSYYVYKSSIVLLTLILFVVYFSREYKDQALAVPLVPLGRKLKQKIKVSFARVKFLLIKEQTRRLDKRINGVRIKISQMNKGGRRRENLALLKNLTKKNGNLTRNLQAIEQLVVISARVEVRSKIKIVSLNRMVSIVLLAILLTWALPSRVVYPVELAFKPSYVPESPFVIAESRLYQDDKWAEQASIILKYSGQTDFNDPYILMEPNYWYLSSQWLNNLNFSWTKEFQNELDALRILEIDEKLSFPDLINYVLGANIDAYIPLIIVKG